jgi:hypothetical protein
VLVDALNLNESDPQHRKNHCKNTDTIANGRSIRALQMKTNIQHEGMMGTLRPFIIMRKSVNFSASFQGQQDFDKAAIRKWASLTRLFSKALSPFLVLTVWLDALNQLLWKGHLWIVEGLGPLKNQAVTRIFHICVSKYLFIPSWILEFVVESPQLECYKDFVGSF